MTSTGATGGTTHRPTAAESRDGRILLVAFAGSFFLHLVGVLVLQRIPVDVTAKQKPARDEVVEILLADDLNDDPQAAERERIFTMIPERLASEVPPPDDPESPIYLAKYHALAANPTVGTDALRPAAAIAAESEAVALRREQLEGAAGVALAARTAAEPRRPEPEAAGSEASAKQAEGKSERDETKPSVGGDRGEMAVPELTERQEAARAARPEVEPVPPPFANWWATTVPSILKQGNAGIAGDRGIDFDQEARGAQTSGVARVGDYSLNTYEWVFAPWMEAFGNTLMRNWVTPPARQMGLISGKTVMHVTVEKSGRVSQAEIVEQEGHGSLHEASRAALLASSPFARLPADFPLAQLEIRLTMFYPEPLR